jgi:hypothetical protein
MTSNNAEPIRVTKRGHRYIKQGKDKLNRVGTIQGFVEYAVAENVEYLQRKLEGADDIRNLCEHISDINGVELKIPKYNFNARLVDKNLNRRVLADLRVKDEERISEIRDCTDLERAKVIRLCLLQQLYEIANETDLFEYPKDEIIQDSWLPAKKTIDSTFPRMRFELHLRVVEQEEFLSNRIKRDQHSGRRLRGYYENYFRRTAGHDRMVEDKLGAETLDRLESVLVTAVEQQSENIP